MVREEKVTQVAKSGFDGIDFLIEETEHRDAWSH